MTTSSCEERRGDLALYALGQLPADEYGDLEAHLSSCSSCRIELVELGETRNLLDYVHDFTRRGPFEGAANNQAGLVSPSATRAPTGRRVRVIAGALATSVLVVVALVAVAMKSSPAGAERSLVLRGAHGAHGVVQLHREPWGTSLTFSETGLAPGRTYRVVMRSGYGTWWSTGTYYASGTSTSKITMACAVALGSISEIRVETTRGVSVLRSVT